MKLLKRLIVFAAFTNGISPIELQAIDFKNLMNCLNQKIDYCLQAFNAYSSKILENQHVQRIAQIYEKKTPVFIKNNIKNIAYGVLISGSIYFLYKNIYQFKSSTPGPENETNSYNKKINKSQQYTYEHQIDTSSINDTRNEIKKFLKEKLPNQCTSYDYKKITKLVEPKEPTFQYQNSEGFWKSLTENKHTPKNFKIATQIDLLNKYGISAEKEIEGVKEAKEKIRNDIAREDAKVITKKIMENIKNKQEFLLNKKLIQRTKLNEKELSQDFVVNYLYNGDDAGLKNLAIFFFEFKEKLAKKEASDDNVHSLLKYLNAYFTNITDEEIKIELTFIIEMLNDYISNSPDDGIPDNFLDVETKINNYIQKKEKNINNDNKTFREIYELGCIVKLNEALIQTQGFDLSNLTCLHDNYILLYNTIQKYAPQNEIVLKNKIFVLRYVNSRKEFYQKALNKYWNTCSSEKKELIAKEIFGNVKPMLDYETLELLDPNQRDPYGEMIKKRKLYKKLRDIEQESMYLKKDISCLQEKIDTL